MDMNQLNSQAERARQSMYTAYDKHNGNSQQKEVQTLSKNLDNLIIEQMKVKIKRRA